MYAGTEYSCQQDRLEIKSNCILCNSTGSLKRLYNGSDKYQRLIGIKQDTRCWFRCKSCGLMWQTNCLSDSDLKSIYSHYRDTSFRNESVKDVFLRIDNMNPAESENEYRYQWFRNHIGMEKGTLLDVGSGFGVWPNKLSAHGWDVVCVEPNEESCDFINEYLNLPCSKSYGLSEVGNGYDVITLVHVLEHIESPVILLREIRDRMNDDGRLFIEVPDSVEFEYLEHDHDEFNSTHLFFYDTAAIYNLLSRVFYVTDIHRVHYKSRNLSRIMAVCRNK